MPSLSQVRNLFNCLLLATSYSAKRDDFKASRRSDRRHSNKSTCCCVHIFFQPFAQWRRQLWGTGARTPPPPSTSNNFIFCSLWSKLDSQVSKYCVVCKISSCRCQQLTGLSISTALVTKLLVTHRAAAAPGPEVRRECTMT